MHHHYRRSIGGGGNIRVAAAASSLVPGFGVWSVSYMCGVYGYMETRNGIEGDGEEEEKKEKY
jgi:hypothetical protein